MQVGDLLASRSAPQVGVDRVPLDRAGAYEGNLHDDVVETPRFETGKRVHLRARLHLKDANRVGCAQQVVDPWILLRKSVQSQGLIAAPMHHSRRPAAQELIRCLSSTCVASLELIEGDAQRRQHAEREQVELDEARIRTILFVPLEDGASRHRCPPHRADARDRLIGEHHASRVDPHVSGQTCKRSSSVTNKGWWFSPALGPGRSRAGGVPESAGDVADRRARAIRDDVGNLCRAIPPKGVVDVLNDLFATACLDVDVDVGGT